METVIFQGSASQVQYAFNRHFDGKKAEVIKIDVSVIARKIIGENEEIVVTLFVVYNFK